MKRVILFLAFVFPITIFVFLRYFGKNEFTIPIYYQTDEIASVPEGCLTAMTIPFLVSENYLKNLGWKGESMLIVIDTSRHTRKDLTELTNEFAEAKFSINYTGSDSTSLQLSRCELLMNTPWTATLVDDQRRIRGYYKPDSREELDRLAVELKILLQKY